MRAADARPNILWITCEDASPNLGCYGDEYAVTPRLDRLAREGVRYTAAFAPIGVCAPSRSCLITGMWPPSIGTHHMRCEGKLPAGVHPFPHYLREAGYYTTNNVKTDYNFTPPAGTWDDSSNRAHWRGRAPGQPFFSVFNFTTTHESQIRLPDPQFERRTKDLPDEARHDPARATLPPYYPDTPETRRDAARFADLVSVMDAEAGAILDELERDGLADETIVFFFSDHGTGLPRSKRWLYDTSTRVPLLIRFPRKFESLAPSPPGSTCDRLVSFVDFAPTVLSLAGVPIPPTMQGVAFLGAAAGAERQYVHGFRDRMDERYDMLRSVRDERYKLIRNYRPELPYFGKQFLSYQWEMPTMQAWQKLADAGQLTGPAAQWMTPIKPGVELYDTVADPWEINNLADEPEFATVRARLSSELERWMVNIIDLGFLPENELRTRFGDEAPYDAVRRSSTAYPLGIILPVAEVAASTQPVDEQERNLLLDGIQNPDPTIAYWAVRGLANRVAAHEPTTSDTSEQQQVLRAALEYASPQVRLVAAEVLAAQGDETALGTLVSLLDSDNEWVRLMAVIALDRLDLRGAELQARLSGLQNDSNQYVRRVLDHLRSKSLVPQ
ncbi:MAG: sulfatase-like hydrolase/transferase [Pirellulales bacterium]|nr:sulfatase-like hydrolase/transferase [Pirellulales bacterium]